MYNIYGQDCHTRWIKKKHTQQQNNANKKSQLAMGRKDRTLYRENDILNDGAGGGNMNLK